LAISLAVLPLLSCAGSEDPSADRTEEVLRGSGDPRHVPPMSGGIQVNEPNLHGWVTAVQSAGLDSVQVTLYARQLGWSSSEMWFATDAPSVVDEIRAAHDAGLRVVLVMRTALEHALPENRHLWHGMIWPSSDAEIDTWFARYRDFLLWGADLAQREGVELLAIGSELNSLTSTVQVTELPDLYQYFLDSERTAVVRGRLVECSTSVAEEWLAPDLEFRDGTRYESLDAFLTAEEEATRGWTRVVTGWRDGEANLEQLNLRRANYERHWRDLIAETRQHYEGPLTYAANFDQVADVGFWDALDAVGVNAYYSLSRFGLAGPDLDEELASSWREIAAELAPLGHGSESDASSAPLPLVFLELGWTRKAGSTVRPFSYHRIEVLETVGQQPDGEVPLTCVHWATQPEDRGERVRALRALLRVVREGALPQLRGFMLWKLTTLPQHREVEPFVVVLPGREDAAAGNDEDFLRVAAELAAEMRRQEVPR
jgi:hypothetical protein